MKKLISVLIAFVLCIACVIPAFADLAAPEFDEYEAYVINPDGAVYEKNDDETLTVPYGAEVTVTGTYDDTAVCKYNGEYYELDFDDISTEKPDTEESTSAAVNEGEQSTTAVFEESNGVPAAPGNMNPASEERPENSTEKSSAETKATAAANDKSETKSTEKDEETEDDEEDGLSKTTLIIIIIVAAAVIAIAAVVSIMIISSKKKKKAAAAAPQQNSPKAQSNPYQQGYNPWQAAQQQQNRQAQNPAAANPIQQGNQAVPQGYQPQFVASVNPVQQAPIQGVPVNPVQQAPAQGYQPQPIAPVTPLQHTPAQGYQPQFAASANPVQQAPIQAAPVAPVKPVEPAPAEPVIPAAPVAPAKPVEPAPAEPVNTPDSPISVVSLNKPGLCQKCNELTPELFKLTFTKGDKASTAELCSDCAHKFIKAYNDSKHDNKA